MLKARVSEICNTWNTQCQDHVVSSWTVEGETKQEIFRKTYPSYRSNRYCNGYRIEFEDPSLNEEFKEYCRNAPIDEYYGGGTVD